MKIVVCVKQVPDIEGRIVVEKGAISLQELVPSYVVNPLDLLAIEEAMCIKEMRIKERDGAGQVTLVSLGSSLAEEALRNGIALGADDAIHLCDTAFNNGDSYATALVLARTISSIPYDLVLCGQRADDSQEGQVGAYLARMLNIPLVQGVARVDTNSEAKKLLVQRKLEKGDREVVECSLPVLLTVETGLNIPRHPTVRGVLKARGKNITQYDSKHLGLSPEEAGERGSRIKMVSLTPPKPKMKGLFVPDSKLSSVDKLRLIMEGGITQKKSDFLEGDPREIASQLIEFFKQQKIVSG